MGIVRWECEKLPGSRPAPGGVRVQPGASLPRCFVISRAKAYRYAELARLLSGRLDLTVVLDRRYGDRRKMQIPVQADRRRPGSDRRQRLVPTSYFGFGSWAETWARESDNELSAARQGSSAR